MSEQTTETRDFHLGDILTITTGCLVSPSYMDGVYKILNWMTGDDLFTHQLPRAGRECAPVLLHQHPQLAEVVTPDTFTGKAHVEAWLAEQVERFGETLPVAPMPGGSRIRMSPLDEIRLIAPDMEVIAVGVPENPNASPVLKRLP